MAFLVHEPADELDSVDIGHNDVENDRRGIEIIEGGHELFGMGRHLDVVTQPFRRAPDDLPKRRLIVDDQQSPSVHKENPSLRP